MKTKIALVIAAFCLLSTSLMAGVTNFSNGVSSYGIPLPTGSGFTGGKVFFVGDSVAGNSDGNPGTMTRPFATIDYAIGRCTASKGDTIYVLPGHTGTVSAAGGIDADVAGIRIIGLGNKDNRPVITLGTADTADIDIDAANIYFENLKFVVAKDGLDTVIDVNADDFTIRNCEFEEGTSIQADEYIDVSANATEIIGNTFRSVAAGMAHAIQINGTFSDIVIKDNWIYGDFSNAGIYSASAFVDALIVGNYVQNLQADDHAVELTAAATGIISDNRFGINSEAATNALDPGSMKLIQCYVATGNVLDDVQLP